MQTLLNNQTFLYSVWLIIMVGALIAICIFRIHENKDVYERPLNQDEYAEALDLARRFSTAHDYLNELRKNGVVLRHKDLLEARRLAKNQELARLRALGE